MAPTLPCINPSLQHTRVGDGALQVQWLVPHQQGKKAARGSPGGLLGLSNFTALPVTPDADYDKATTKVDHDKGAVSITLAGQGVA